MNLRFDKTCLTPVEGILRVTSLTYSPNGKKLAVATTDRVVTLFDGIAGECYVLFSPLFGYIRTEMRHVLLSIMVYGLGLVYFLSEPTFEVFILVAS